MKAFLLIVITTALLLPGCNTTHTVTVEPVEVKPIHMTLDVNIRIDKQLDEFFDFEDEFEAGGN